MKGMFRDGGPVAARSQHPILCAHSGPERKREECSGQAGRARPSLCGPPATRLWLGAQEEARHPAWTEGTGQSHTVPVLWRYRTVGEGAIPLSQGSH